MKLVIFGLSISSSWGNGHATLWRGLCRGLAARGHTVTFFEQDVPYYAAHRDLPQMEHGELVLFRDWNDVESRAQEEVASADVAMVTSYCPVARQASPVVLEHGRCRVFYDLDTPVTLARVRAGEDVPYLPERGLSDFDLALSFTGGEALRGLQEELGASRVAPLYGSVDPAVHRRVESRPHYACDLSYLGTYSVDRQATLEELFVRPARLRADRKFVMGGAQFPDEFPWTENLHFVRHLPPAEHPAFFSSSRYTLNVTRGPMREFGFCPSGRLFEAAACGTPIISDAWEGLEQFFTPLEEIVVAEKAEDVLAALDRSAEDAAAMARRARERVLAAHTAERRAEELETILETAAAMEVGG
jgi:spore maturation protein CgeB